MSLLKNRESECELARGLHYVIGMKEILKKENDMSTREINKMIKEASDTGKNVYARLSNGITAVRVIGAGRGKIDSFYGKAEIKFLTGIWIA